MNAWQIAAAVLSYLVFAPLWYRIRCNHEPCNRDWRNKNGNACGYTYYYLDHSHTALCPPCANRQSAVAQAAAWPIVLVAITVYWVARSFIITPAIAAGRALAIPAHARQEDNP